VHEAQSRKLSDLEVRVDVSSGIRFAAQAPPIRQFLD